MPIVVENGIEIGNGITITSGPGGGGNVVTSGLQVQLRPDSYVGSGATWNDTQSNANGTFYNASTQITNAQTVFDYNSTTGFTINNYNNTNKYWIGLPSIAGITDFTTSDNYTVELWANISSLQRLSSTTLLNKRYTNVFTPKQGIPYFFEYSSVYGLDVNVVGNSNAGSISATSFNPPVDTWIQIVGVFNWTGPTTGQINLGYQGAYMNGQLQMTNTLSVVQGEIQNNFEVCIGGWFDQPLNTLPCFFQGGVGILRIYNKALTGAEVLQNFNADRGIFGI